MTNEHLVVFITAPRGEGEKIAGHIVEKRLAACVNIVRGIESIYWWEGKVEKDEEELLIVKTRGNILDKLIEEVKKVHPYKVPEIIAIPITAGNRDYLEWIEREVNG